MLVRAAMAAICFLGCAVHDWQLPQRNMPHADGPSSNVNRPEDLLCFKHVEVRRPSFVAHEFVRDRCNNPDKNVPGHLGIGQRLINFFHGQSTVQVHGSGLVFWKEIESSTGHWRGYFREGFVKRDASSSACQRDPSIQVSRRGISGVLDTCGEFQSNAITILSHIASGNNIDFYPRALRCDGCVGSFLSSSDRSLHVFGLLSGGGLGFINRFLQPFVLSNQSAPLQKPAYDKTKRQEEKKSGESGVRVCPEFLPPPFIALGIPATMFAGGIYIQGVVRTEAKRLLGLLIAVAGLLGCFALCFGDWWSPLICRFW